jgi:hypothetical protein
MHFRKLLFGTSLISCSLLGALIGPATAPEGQPNARLALLELQSEFHEAGARGDYELMLSLWAENAVFSNPSGTIHGRTAIADFFASGSGWGEVAALTASYKSTFDIRGNRADFAFECIIVDVSGMGSTTTSLSTLPFGSQNPDVEIVQHSNATCTAVKENGRWVFESFVGGGGALLP